MRIVRFSSLVYQPAKVHFLSQNPHFVEFSYRDQQKLLFSRFITYGNSFAKTMSLLGWESFEVVYDLKPMQEKWACEEGIQYKGADWQTDIAFAQIARMRPEILFFQDIHLFNFTQFSTLKNRFPFLKLIVIFRGYPGVDSNLLKVLACSDLLLVGSPILLKKCREAGLNPYLVYHSFDSEILDFVPDKSTRPYSFTFAGSSGYGYGWNHQPRYSFLSLLLSSTCLQAWVEENKIPRSLRTNIREQIRKALMWFPQNAIDMVCEKLESHTSWAKLFDEVSRAKALLMTTHNINSHWLIPDQPLCKRFPLQCRGPLFGLELYQLLAQSEITFNKHAAAAQGTVDNIRLFQATGMGSCLLTDNGENLKELFEPDREVVTYTSFEECLEKVNYLLHHERVRKDIAQSGQKKTLMLHTSAKRAEAVHELLVSVLKGK